MQQQEFTVTYHIPPCCIVKSYDYQSKPLIIGASVFDAKSLGEWIVNWTDYIYGTDSLYKRISEFIYNALCEFSDKISVCHDILESNASYENKVVVYDFVKSSNRVYERFQNILNLCSDKMRLYTNKGSKKTCDVGRVQTALEILYERDKELQSIVDIVYSISIWISRFIGTISEISLLRNRSYSSL